MADTTIQQSGASGATPIKVVDQGDGTYALKVSGLGGGGGTAGQAIGLLLALTKAS